MSRVRNKTENRYPKHSPGNGAKNQKKYTMDMSADCPHDVHRKCPKLLRGKLYILNSILCIGKRFPFNGRRADKTKTGPALAKISLQMKRKAFYFDFLHTLDSRGTGRPIRVESAESSSKANVLALFLFSFANCWGASCFPAFYVGNLSEFGRGRFG